MQHKTLLATAITAALLISCSDDKTTEKKNEPTKLAAVSAAQMADEAEARYKNSSKGIPGKYHRNADNATAETTVTVPQRDGNHITLNLTETITYSQELREQGIIARVESQITPQESFIDLAKALAPWPITDDSMPRSIAAHWQMRDDLLADNNVRTTYIITPFQTQDDDGDSFDFKGMQYDTQYNEQKENIAESRLNIEPITMSRSSKTGQGGTATITAIKGNWGNKDDGSAYLDIEPIKIEATDINGLSSLEIAGVKGSGNGVAYDETFGAYLGQGSINIHNIRYTGNGKVTPIGDIQLDMDNHKNATGNYDSTFGLALKLDGASLQQAIPVLPVAPQHLRLNLAVNDISARANSSLNEAVQIIKVQAQQGGRDIPQTAKDKLDTVLTDIIRDKTRFSADLSADTNSGSARVSAQLGIRKDSSDSLDTWQAAVNSAQENNPAALQNLLKNNLDLQVDIRVSKALADKTGLTPLIEDKGAVFITLVDDEYRVKLENSDGKIKLNGMPLPF